MNAPNNTRKNVGIKVHLDMTFRIMFGPPEPSLRGGIRESGNLEFELDLGLGVLLVAEGARVAVLLRHPLASVTVRPPGTSDGL